MQAPAQNDGVELLMLGGVPQVDEINQEPVQQNRLDDRFEDFDPQPDLRSDDVKHSDINSQMEHCMERNEDVAPNEVESLPAHPKKKSKASITLSMAKRWIKRWPFLNFDLEKQKMKCEVFSISFHNFFCLMCIRFVKKRETTISGPHGTLLAVRRR